MQLHQLVYISRAATPFGPVVLHHLAERCSAKNAPRQVTGLLLYSSGHFMQLLEGPQTVVSGLFDIIHTDRRHTAVQRLLFKPVAGRLFPKWHMGLLNLDATTNVSPHGLSKVLCEARPDANLPAGTEGALALLREFRQQLPVARPA